MDDKKNNTGDSNLESQETVVTNDTTGTAAGAEDQANSLENNGNTPQVAAAEVTVKPSIGKRIRGLITHLNIYLLLFIFIVVLAAGTVLVAMQKSKKAAAPTTISTQPLSNETLSQLKDSDAKVGDPKQTLTIESNAIFSGKVLIRDSLDVAGAIKVGGSLSLPGISVSGSSNFDQILANNLAISGNATVQGQLNVQKNITATGGATFGAPISAPLLTVGALRLSGDLQIVRHIDAGGGSPGKTDGTALGNGGTSTVSGSDTAGTITINTGGSPAPGCFTTVSFNQTFGSTPHVVVTPVGSAAGGLNYYVNRTNSGFSVCSTNAAPAGQSFSFDYVAID